MSDRVLYIQGKKVGTTNVSVFDQSMKLIGVLDVEVAIDYRQPAGEDPLHHGQPWHPRPQQQRPDRAKRRRRERGCSRARRRRCKRSGSAALRGYAGIPSLRLSLIISRPPRDAAMQFEQLNRREFITLAGGQLRRDNRGHVCSSRGPLPPP